MIFNQEPAAGGASPGGDVHRDNHAGEEARLELDELDEVDVELILDVELDVLDIELRLDEELDEFAILLLALALLLEVLLLEALELLVESDEIEALLEELFVLDVLTLLPDIELDTLDMLELVT